MRRICLLSILCCITNRRLRFPLSPRVPLRCLQASGMPLLGPKNKYVNRAMLAPPRAPSTTQVLQASLLDREGRFHIDLRHAQRSWGSSRATFLAHHLKEKLSVNNL